jgi:hypothetical protein
VPYRYTFNVSGPPFLPVSTPPLQPLPVNLLQYALSGQPVSRSEELPQKNIAASIGTIPETLSRLISRLEEGVISWKGKLLTVKKGFWEDNDHDE